MRMKWLMVAVLSLGVLAAALLGRGEADAATVGGLDLRISRSRGVEGGLVLLWPRIIPSADTVALRPQAHGVQARLRRLANSVWKGRPIDQRPEPERVCPEAGCRGARLGALLLHRAGGCAVVATLGRPGRSVTRLVPWAGKVKLKAFQIPFRAKPESYVTIEDLVPCAELPRELEAGAARVERALREQGR